MSGGASTKSTQPVAIAARGMLSYFAVRSSCAKVIPPAAFTAFKPCAPSDPAPDKITAMALSFWSAASDMRKLSIDRAAPSVFSRGDNLRTPCESARSQFGGMT
jgi:hypothetical protein